MQINNTMRSHLIHAKEDMLSCPVLPDSATLWTAAHQGPLSMGIFQGRILEWVVMLSSRGSSQPRDRTQVFRIAGRFFTAEPPGKPKNTGVGSLSLLQGIFPLQVDSLPAKLPWKPKSESVSLSVMYGSLQPGWTVAPPGSSVHRILQARTLEWVTIPFSRGLSNPGIKPESPTLQADFLPSDPPGRAKGGWLLSKRQEMTITSKNILFCTLLMGW